MCHLEHGKIFVDKERVGLKKGALRAIADTLKAKELPGRLKVFHPEVTAELGLHAQELGGTVADNQKITRRE